MLGVELDVERASHIRRHLSKLLQMERIPVKSGRKALKSAIDLQGQLESLTALGAERNHDGKVSNSPAA